MWGWKPAKRMLDALWTAGILVVAARQNFQRLYDLPERVLPAAAAGGAGAVRDGVPAVADHPGGAGPRRPDRVRDRRARAAARRHARGIRPHVDALVGEGVLERVAVDDGGPPVLVQAGTALDEAEPTGSVLLSPFDNLLWDRPFARRILGFDHLIEVYKPAPQRQYGYYVLPLLHHDRIVGRADVKADRQAGTLIVRAYHPERGFRSSAPLERAAARLARILGLERYELPARSTA